MINYIFTLLALFIFDKIGRSQAQVVIEKPKTDAAFEEALNRAGDVPCVIDFFATWCGPCVSIAPVFEELSQQYPNLKFIKVNVDTCTDTARKYSVTAMPTFLGLHKKEEMGRVVGAIKSELKAKVREWAQRAPAQADSPVLGQHDLSAFIDKDQSECLNARNSLNSLLNGKGALVSDADDQIIINLAFKQPVKVHSILIKGPEEHEEQRPNFVKIFANIPHTLGFDEAKNTKGIETIKVVDDKPIALKYVLLQKVNNLQLFVENNIGGVDQTAIDQLQIYGSPLDTTDMGDFKRVVGKAGESGGNHY